MPPGLHLTIDVFFPTKSNFLVFVVVVVRLEVAYLRRSTQI
jgi:hypothetical protein